MMTCEEFRWLDEWLQEHVLLAEGAFLMMRKTERLQVELFALNNFYVEVFTDMTSAELLYIKSFEDVRYLDVYLDTISIEGCLTQ